ncbi:hypothetical protein Cde04nite_13700 [Cellulomonas denverensis]|nr:hypothetical protein Cde04nite_13700 [Cellulomonas denverensis]
MRHPGAVLGVFQSLTTGGEQLDQAVVGQRSAVVHAVLLRLRRRPGTGTSFNLRHRRLRNRRSAVLGTVKSARDRLCGLHNRVTPAWRAVARVRIREAGQYPGGTPSRARSSSFSRWIGHRE